MASIFDLPIDNTQELQLLRLSTVLSSVPGWSSFPLRILTSLVRFAFIHRRLAGSILGAIGEYPRLGL